MNILIIGNGFDLAHDLPTGYLDFLEFVEHVYFFLKDEVNKNTIISHKVSFNKYNGKLHDVIYCELHETFCISHDNGGTHAKKAETKNRTFSLIEDNMWVEFFLKRKLQAKSNGWIDFELEIANVIKRLDKDYNSMLINKITKISLNDFIYSNESSFSQNNRQVKLDGMGELITKLEKDLKRFMDLLEIYLKDFVGKIKPRNQSAEIKALGIDKVLSFNYTTTYENGYSKCDVDYIHGKIGDGNIILGINEYLDEGIKDENLHFIKFKKYFQRIHNKTGSEYKNWLETDILKKIYIFGHSMDISDKDILREFLNNKTTVVTIYYHNDEAYQKLIINIVRLIGQDKLIEKVSNKKPTLFFKQQKEMKCI